MSRQNRPPGSASSRAYSPIQVTMACGRVKYSYTRSGGAWMWMEAVTDSAVIGGLHGVLQPGQLFGPELGQEVPQRGEPFRAHRVQASLAVGPDRDQSRVLKHLQVLGDRLLSDVEVAGALLYRATPGPHNNPDVPTTRHPHGRDTLHTPP